MCDKQTNISYYNIMWNNYLRVGVLNFQRCNNKKILKILKILKI